jgi:hypothetical protein
VDARLLVTDRDPQGRETVEVAHEALLRVWPTLAAWIAEDAGKLRLLDGLQRAADEWDRQQRRNDLLLHREGRLVEVETLVAELRFAARLRPHHREYLAACREAHDARERQAREEQERQVRDAKRIAEEERKNAEAQKRIADEQKRRTRISIIAACVALLLACFAGWQYVNAVSEAENARKAEVQADKDRKRAEQRLAEANASLIWSQLEFDNKDELKPHEIDGLWNLTTAEPPTRAAFLEQLNGNRSLVLKLARCPEVVFRAFGINLTDEQAQTVLGSVLTVFENTTDPEALWSLARTVRALEVQLSDDQASMALARIRGAFDHADSTITLETLSDAARLLSFALNRDGMSNALAVVIDKVSRFNNPRMIASVVKIMRQFPIPTTHLQERQTFGPIFQSTLHAAIDPIDPELLSVVISAEQVPSLTLDLDQATTVLRRVLIAAASTTNPEELTALTNVLRNLPIELNTSQVQEVLDPILRLMMNTKYTKTLDSLVDAVQNLTPKLAPKQALSVLDMLINILRDVSAEHPTRSGEFASSMLSWGIAHTVENLVPRLDRYQVQSALDPLLAILGRSSGETAGAAVWTMGAIAPKLTAEQAQTALHAILDAFPRLIDNSDLSEMNNVGDLGRQLTIEQGSAVLIRIVDVFGSSSRSEALLASAQMLPSLPVAPSSEQVRAMLDHLLRVLKQEDDSQAVGSLASVFPILAPGLKAEQANIALIGIFDALKRPTNRYVRRVLALAMHAVAPKLRREERGSALRVASSGLGMAGSAMEAVAWARAREVLIRDQAVSEYIQQIVETLEYPNSALEEKNGSIATNVARRSSSGAEPPNTATEYLLNSLHEHLNNTRVPESINLKDSLSWIADNYPDIELARPPQQPAPLYDTLSSIKLPD